MSRSGRVGLVCALLVLAPAATWAVPYSARVQLPIDGASVVVPYADQPATFTADADTGIAGITITDVSAEPGSPPLCVAALNDVWECPLGASSFFPPGSSHELQVTTTFTDLTPDDTTNFTMDIGPSALAITSQSIEPGTNKVIVSGIRDAGELFSVTADFEDSGGAGGLSLGPLSLDADVPCNGSPVAGSGFSCAKDYPDDLAPGTVITVTVHETVGIELPPGATPLPPATSAPINLVVPAVSPPPAPPDENDSSSSSSGQVGSIPVVPIPLATTPPTPPPLPAPTAAVPSPAPAPTATPDTTGSSPASATPEDDTLRLLLLAAIAFAVLAMIGPHSLAYASDQVRRRRSRGAEHEGEAPLLAETDAPGGGDGAVAGLTLAAVALRDAEKARGGGTTHARRYGLDWGDRSPTWQFPGWKRIDRASKHIPMKLSRRLPLVARLGADANYLRAVFGTLWLLMPLAGLVLGLLAAEDTGGLPLAPTTAITLGLMVFAILDAGSGAVAVLAFTVSVLVRDGLSSEGLGVLDGLRGLAVLAALWFAIPLIAAAARPFRRLSEPEHVYRWDRGGDGVIAAVVGGLAVYGTTAGFSDLIGRPADISHHAGMIALVAAATILVRVAVEEIIMAGYPARLRAVQHTSPLGEPIRTHRFRGILVRALLMALLASAATGNCWQLWLGVALFVVPQLLALIEDRFPNVAELHRRLPRGIVKFFIVMVIGLVLARLVVDAHQGDRVMALRYGFVLLACPGFILTMLGILGRTSPAPPWTWPRQLAGAMIVVATLLVAFLAF